MRAKTRAAYLDAQLEYESVRPCPEERTTLIEGIRGHLERARTAADEKFCWRSPWSGSTAREGVWSNARSAEVMLLQSVSDAEGRHTLTGEDPGGVSPFSWASRPPSAVDLPATRMQPRTALGGVVYSTCCGGPGLVRPGPPGYGLEALVGGAGRPGDGEETEARQGVPHGDLGGA
ncbi:hypothetical protein [Streptomyces massasporeus]|uniref:hypothetical protein n=1 Tax=Streptomyces massasporeus TaxID=67324 RepID=UPI003F4CB5D7